MILYAKTSSSVLSASKSLQLSNFVLPRDFVKISVGCC